jgi:hypothetical protein
MYGTFRILYVHELQLADGHASLYNKMRRVALNLNTAIQSSTAAVPQQNRAFVVLLVPSLHVKD